MNIAQVFLFYLVLQHNQTEVEEHELIHLLKSQQEKGIRFFVDSYQQRIFSLVLKFVFNPLDAEDIAQETFMDALIHIHEYDEKASLSTWLYRIAVNRSLMFIRAKKRQKRFAFIRSIFNEEDDEPMPIEDIQANV